MIPRGTLYKSRTGIGEYRLVMSSTRAGGGDDLRYKYLCLVRYRIHVQRSSALDSSATEAELDEWGKVVPSGDDYAEITQCVSCAEEHCSNITLRAGRVCTACAAATGAPAGRYRSKRRR